MGGPPGAAGNPDDRNNGTKLSGKEPAIFDGDRSKAEAFLLEWTIYRLLNGEQDIMRQPFSWVMLFLPFIKGPDVQEWAGSLSRKHIFYLIFLYFIWIYLMKYSRFESLSLNDDKMVSHVLPL